MPSHQYNSGTGIDIIEYFSSNVEQLQLKDISLESNINSLTITVASLNPSNYDVQLSLLQNKDIEIDSNLTLLFTGYSNNSNSFSTLSNYVSTINADGSNYDVEILALQNKDVSIDSNILSLQTSSNIFKNDIDILQDDYLQTSTDILNLQTKDDLLDTDIATINSTLTTLSNVDSNLTTRVNTNSNLISSLTTETISLLIGYSNNSNLIYDLSLIQITDRNNLNAGISNLSILSSNFTSNTTNFAGDIINLNSGISNLSILSSNYAYITDIDSLNSGYSNNLTLINNQISKEALDVSFLNTGYSNNLGLINTNTTNLTNQINKEALDVSFLNTGYSNNLGLINTNITNITTVSNDLATQVAKEALDVSFLNTGISNNITSIGVVSNDLATQVAKEALDVSFLNTGISNNTTSIGVVSNDLAIQISKEALDVSFLNTGYSNNLGLITTNTNNISTQSTILTNQINKEALDVSFLNTGYSNNLGLINTNITNITTLSNSLSSQITKEANDVISLNAGVSNLSTLSSNYATLTGTQTLTNKTIDFNLNTILNATGGSSGGQIYTISQITRKSIVNSNLARAYMTTNLTNLTNNTLTLVPLNTETYDNNNDYNTTTNRFVAPFTGYYNIIATNGFTDLSSGQGQTGSIYKNTSNVLCSFIALNSTDTTNISSPLNDLVLLTAGDFIDLKAIQNTGGNAVDILGTTQDTNLSVSLVSLSSNVAYSPVGSTLPLSMSNLYNPYVCRVYLSGNTGTLTMGVQNKIMYDVKNIDVNNNFSTSSYYAPIAGYYQINSAVVINNNASTGNYNSYGIKLNGTAISYVYGHNNASSKNQSYRCNDQVYLAVNDRIDTYFMQADYTGVNIVGGNDLTYMSIFLVSCATPTTGLGTTSFINMTNIYNTYLCKITKNASQTGMANAVWTTIQFNVKTYDLNNNFNTSTYRYTAPFTGYYHCKAKIAIGGTVIGNKKYGVGILKNNSTFSSVNYYQSKVTNELGFGVDDNIYLVAGDYIEVQFYNGSGANQSTVGFGYVEFMNFSVQFITSSVITPSTLSANNTFYFT